MCITLICVTLICVYVYYTHMCYTHMCITLICVALICVLHSYVLHSYVLHTDMCHTTLTCIIPHACHAYASQVARVEPIDMAGGQMDFSWDQVGRDTFTCVTTHSYLCHDAFVCETCLIPMCDMTHSYASQFPFLFVT